MARAQTISVVIPIYNQERFVEAAVRSVLGQTVQPLEVILVDDGSTDNTAAVAEAIRDPRILLLRQANSGPSQALNAGILASQGDIISFLGGDDLATPIRLEAQQAMLTRERADLVFSDPILINEDGMQIPSEPNSPFRMRLDKWEPSVLLRKLFYSQNFICAPSVALTRETIQDAGLFHAGLIQLQDFDYWLRVICAGRRLIHAGTPLVRYRIRRPGENLSDSMHSSGRVDLELMYILRRLHSMIPESLARETFPEVFRGVGPLSPIERHFVKAAIFLLHDHRPVRRIGFELLLDLSESAEGRTVLEGEGITLPALFDMMREP